MIRILSPVTLLIIFIAATENAAGFKTIVLTRSKFVTTKRHNNFAINKYRYNFSLLQLAEDAQEAEIISENSSEKAVSNVKESSLLERLDEYGLNLKPRAFKARDEAAALYPTNRKKSLSYNVKACLFLSMFIVYRAYRGFFVILPAVFREVSSRLEATVGGLAIETDVNRMDESNEKKLQDIDPKTGKLRTRTAITVSVLAGMLTFIYTLSGAFKVLIRFLKTIFETRKVEPAFEAAVSEVELNEGRLSKIGNRTSKDFLNGKEIPNNSEKKGYDGLL